jgi:asparagine synthase (glutamine-hydrolysing)
MCGFSGFVQFEAQQFDQAQRLRILKGMGAAIAHRGPDDEQIYDDGVLSLVFRRLSIVDVGGGRQPIFSEDTNKLIVCNGEIYNHDELRRSLTANHQFTTQSDSEVLLHGYEQWGLDVLQRARGMFAMAIWDRAQRRLLLARDRMGIKPLYVCHLPNGILFGSELKALLAHPLCPREMDWHDLSGNPVAHRLTPTYIRGVEHLPGASYLISQAGKQAKAHSYWSLEPHFDAAPFGLTAKQYVSAFDQLIEDAVLEHLQGDAGTGLHLSGGVDSSLVAAIAGVKKPDLKSFTIVERSNYVGGDVKAAQNVAAAIGLDWSPVLFDYRTLLNDTEFGLHSLEQAAWMMDSPLFDMEWTLKREFNRAIRTHHPHLKVLLLGQGADEFSGGYSTRMDAPYTSWDAYLSEEVQHFLSMGAANEPIQASYHSVHVSKRSQSKVNPYHQMMNLMTRQLQHHNLWHEDRTSSAFGMEARVPFLDHRIVEFFASVPSALHGQLFWNKDIIRQALHKRIPRYDPKHPKIGFCWASDSRSLDLVIHDMALQASAEFRDKYVSDKDYPFDRAQTDQLIHQIRTRQPGFQAASVTLLQQMSATLFRSNVQQVALGMVACDKVFAPSRLEVIAPSRWAQIDQQLLAAPVSSFAWQFDHCLRIQSDCSIRKCHQANAPAQALYQLVAGRTVHAELSLSKCPVWLDELMTLLNEPASSDLTVQDWARHFACAEAELISMFDVLLQCGFISTPHRYTQPAFSRGAWTKLRHQLWKNHWLAGWGASGFIARCLRVLRRGSRSLMEAIQK